MKISVIIPVYNVEKYLRECLDSVINQTYKDLEIICVNDASTDSSPDILLEYAKKDSRIILINNEKNSKLGPTRNHGMEYATGEYIHFLDSDDWMELDAYEKLANYVSKVGNVDIVHFLWNNRCVVTGKVTPCIYNDLSILEKVINIKNTPNLAVNWRRGAWCKLYRRQFLIEKHIVFNDYPCLEDIEHSIHVLTEAESVYLVPDLFLNYRTNNSGSLMGKHHKFFDYAIKSYYTNIGYCKNFDDRTKIIILDIELYNLFNILYESFIRGTLSLNNVRQIINELDLTLFGEDIKNYRWYLYYNDLMNKPAYIAKFKQILRHYMRDNIPFLHKFLVNIRRKYMFLRRI